jgi:heme-degrading monooxygenase HmoA
MKTNQKISHNLTTKKMAYNKKQQKEQKEYPSIWLNLDVENLVFCKCLKHDETEKGYFANCLFRTEQSTKSEVNKYIVVTLFGSAAFFAANDLKNGDECAMKVWVQARKAENGEWYNGVTASAFESEGYDEKQAENRLKKLKNAQPQKEEVLNGREGDDDLPF